MRKMDYLNFGYNLNSLISNKNGFIGPLSSGYCTGNIQIFAAIPRKIYTEIRNAFDTTSRSIDCFKKTILDFHRKYFYNGIALPQEFNRRRQYSALPPDFIFMSFDHYDNALVKSSTVNSVFSHFSYIKKGRISFMFRKVKLDLANLGSFDITLKKPAFHSLPRDVSISKNYVDLKFCQSMFSVQEGEIIFRTPLKVSQLSSSPIVNESKVKKIDSKIIPNKATSKRQAYYNSLQEDGKGASENIPLRG